jgi:hypothetical protein
MRGDGKGVAKGETQRGEKSAHHAVRHGVLFSLMGFPLRREIKLVTFIALGSMLERQAIMA